MKRLLAVLAVVLLSACGPVDTGLPAETVRVVASTMGQMCSAVAIAPDYALTARHCLSQGMFVDSLKVAYISASGPEHEDMALVHVPGLQCPCAVLGERPAAGDTAVAIGFPTDLNGARRITDPTIVHVGRPDALAPWVRYPTFTAISILSSEPVLDHGDSGGGLFSRQEGQWRLIGINSIGVPATDNPFGTEEQASGFVPVDVAIPFLPEHLK